MNYIILSDIHSNLPAFEAVIKAFPKKYDKIICAGDIVGYGAEPNECIKLLLSLGADNILGNHDAAVIGKMNSSNFNEYAQEAVFWTQAHIAGGSRNYLEGLEHIRKEDFFTAVHGTLHRAEKFQYMMTGADAMHTFEILETQVCFVGHSHLPGVFVSRNGRLTGILNERIPLQPDAKYIVNAGSVGQPRDGDPRACFCTYDTDKSEIGYHRVEYDVETARERIIDAGLPQRLGDRLLWGR
ncbi:MAG: metallophosphoesterase family protein [Candidatus Omnitrophica bacterium]|nr:metallophosphoesterase family protein [Candidatus Omnitrophota bacterium]